MRAIASGSRLREKIPQLEQALLGHFGPHQRFMVTQQVVHIDTLDDLIARVSAEVTERLRPCAPALAQLDAIRGVGRRTAEVLVAAIGLDLSRFPSAGQLAAWAGLAPGNNESAGQARRAPVRKGSPWLRAAVVEAAQAAGRSKDSYLSAQYRRLAARRGKKRAAIAVAHSILTIAYHLLTTRQPYRDLGVTYFDHRDRERVERRLVRRLEALGYTVSLQSPPSAA